MEPRKALWKTDFACYDGRQLFCCLLCSFKYLWVLIALNIDLMY